MNSTVGMALLATLGTWALTALGAATVIFFKSPSKRVMNMLLGFAAGVMIAASFWSLLAPAAERAQRSSSLPAFAVVTLGFLAGALFLWVSDKIVTRTRGTKKGPHRTLMLILSITLHNIPEGLAVGVAFGALQSGGVEALMGAITIAVGIGLQNFPEGAAVSLPLRRDGFSRGLAFFLGQASGMVEPLAGVLGAIVVLNLKKKN